MISGFKEAVAIVQNARHAADKLSTSTCWEVLGEYRCSSALLDAWGLPPDSKGSELLLGNPQVDSGFLRLVEISGNCSQLIRSHPQSWDIGGILDLNVRVENMPDHARAFSTAGWYAVSDPVDWRFGDKLVSEWLAYAPDGLAFALIERLEPALPAGAVPGGFGHIFNSSQVVRDMAVALDFYQHSLGFEKLLHICQPLLPSPGPNPLGIPHNLIAELDVEIAILSPSGEMDGSVELIRMHGLEGRDFSAAARPPNLGMCALRFPVSDIDALSALLTRAGRQPEYSPVETELLPYGRCRVMAVRAPDGAWLEFYQVA